MKSMTKCRYADKYKAKRPPKCGCDMCNVKWKIAVVEQMMRDHHNAQFAGYPGYD